ncbi:hypothetical protein GCM10007216_31140 [Thalassobacillus devorans]|uniref:CBS domain-containing protein n=1 Tax=Thalassobacillus devorans TaxID=279813 RepID=A0ABQ1PJI9_9BACI|nr:DUF294 nucleotidyltransferase-like domain-containing protein [Thalassobacillus devorans]NIK30073.1 CBS domain-containing protein [Thalassobacillus devorans]GGC98131.1 hypothetical protein GCM10007216_31140 [Thalassobacillus devorans]
MERLVGTEGSTLNSYEEIRDWRQTYIKDVSTDHDKLNSFHDEVITATVKCALDYVQRERGNPPAPFAFFLMGSAGRFEQSVFSDQDHGIIFAGSQGFEDYFLTLGLEITVGLEVVGYQRCDGKVMASNPLWCQSLSNWNQQVNDWLTEANWTSLRHFSTFFDSRVLIGEDSFLEEIKREALRIIHARPELFIRLVENVDFIKKGVGVFGQLLPGAHGEQSGKLHVKQTAFFPYVNAMRLLAFKEGILAPSTLTRFKEIKADYPSMHRFEDYFMKLLDFRLRFQQDVVSYDEAHLIAMAQLTKEDKKELKLLMKKGYELFSEIKKVIDNECSAWS